MKLSIVTTIYRTANELPELYTRAVRAAGQIGCDYEFILVNDASPDDGLAVAKGLAAADAKVTVIDLARNYGQHKAVWTGLKHATGDFIGVLDSDLEDEPEWLAAFYDRMIATGSDIAYGVRTHRHRPALYRASRRIFHFMLDIASGQRFPRNATSARLMTRRCVDALMRFEETEVYLLGLYETVGFSRVAVPVQPSRHSKTSYTLRKLLAVFVRGVTSYSILPLVVVFVVGLTLSLLSAIFVAYLLFQKFVIATVVEGWTSVMAAIMVLGGLTLLLNGIIAIYVGIIFLEVKRRPTVIREITAKGPALAPMDDGGHRPV